ncbi:MAG: hypothetical protein AAGC74_07875 [Verrucomicrobiota bacterium]
MKTLTLTLLIITQTLIHAAPVSINLTGTNATESNGDGWALRFPDFDGGETTDTHSDTDPNTGVNPVQFAPIPIDPNDPDFDVNTNTNGPLDPGMTTLPGAFNLGTLTYDDASLTNIGSETIAVTNSTFDFDFDDYALAFGIEVRVPVTFFVPGTTITLSNISGPGLQFLDGELLTANFTADLAWQPTINGTDSTTDGPYNGTLTVQDGLFTFNITDTKSIIVGFISVPALLEFDLIAQPNALKLPANPSLAISDLNPSAISLQTTFTNPGPGLFQLEQSSTLLSNSWQPVGSAFGANLPSTITQTLPASPAFYRVASLTDTSSPITFSLASTMSDDSTISEFDLTASFARLGNGDGSSPDADGFWDLSNPTVRFGSENPITSANDVFPNENNFSLGSLTFDPSSLIGSGSETIAISSVSLDLSEDIASSALATFVSGASTTLTFGTLDPSSTLTFTDKVLTSLDLTIPFNLTYSTIQGPLVYSGELATEGNTLSITMASSVSTNGFTPSGVSRMVWDLNGTLNAVGNLSLP